MSRRAEQFLYARVHVHQIVAIVAACLGCDTTSPELTLDGLWGGRYDYVTATDTLTLALTQEGSEVEGFGILRTSENPSRYYDFLRVRGSVTAGSVEFSVFPVDRPAVPCRLAGTVEGGELSGTVDLTADERPVTLRRFQPLPADAVGTWVLASRAGLPEQASRPVRDTVIVQADGRAHRNRAEEGLFYVTDAMWSRRGDWLMLDQFIVMGGSVVPPLDSLRLEPGALLRMMPALDGSTIVERFVRVSTPGVGRVRASRAP